MRYKPLLRALGILLLGEAVLMLPSLIVSLIYGEGDSLAFAATIVILVMIGWPLSALIEHRVRDMHAREGFALVGFGWLMLSVFGCLPFLISRAIPSPIDAFFETVSGFTTTGASVLTQIEGLAHGLLFWRSFTHWVGGMGVLVLTIALMPQLGLKNMEVLRAESPGPNPEKLLPRIRETAKMLYMIYLGMSVVLFILLLFTGMSPFDSAVNTFSTAGTGGFSVRNASIAAYNDAAAEIILGVFMLLFGVNFTVYFMLLTRQFKKALSNQELLWYFGIVACAVLFILIDIAPRYANAGESLRYAFFQVSSIVTTTGYATVDFNIWPTFSKCILMALMLMGCCAGSTGGGIKVIRLLVAGKAARREMAAVVNPRIVRAINVNGKRLEEGTIRSVLNFMFVYVLIIIGATLVVSTNNFDFTTTLTSVIATISNTGPGLEFVGPIGNYSAFSGISKLTLSFCMLVGRLEIAPILMLFMPSSWKRL